ncbi:unnamed protein product, partial [marine sediment metagenome]
RKGPYFTRNASELRVAKRFQNTNIFIETNLGADQIVKICFRMLDVLGYPASDLRIEARGETSGGRAPRTFDATQRPAG